MSAKNLRTADYPEHARIRLGDAVAKARRAAGHRWRPSFVNATGVGKRSLEAVERAEPVVGISALEDIGRALGQYWRDWNPDTPRSILEGGPIPPNVKADEPAATDSPGPDLRDEFERAVWAVTSVTEEEKWLVIDIHRARAQRRNEVDPPRTA